MHNLLTNMTRTATDVGLVFTTPDTLAISASHSATSFFPPVRRVHRVHRFQFGSRMESRATHVRSTKRMILHLLHVPHPVIPNRACTRALDSVLELGTHVTSSYGIIESRRRKTKDRMSSKLVLTIDGGGTRGFFSHQIVKHVSTLDVQVDLIVGVSVGAVIGAMYAAGIMDDMTPEQLVAQARTVFGAKTDSGPWFKPTLEGSPKTQALATMFGEMRFGDLDIDMAILVDCINGKPEIFMSWDPRYRDLPLVQVLDATSAVPVMFPPVRIGPKQYIDGATVTNSPITISHLLGIQHFPGHQIRILSVGTVGAEEEDIGTRFETEEMGIIQLLALGIPTKILIQSSSVTNALSINILGSDGFYRVEGHVQGSIDDISIYPSCIQTADTVWHQQVDGIRSFVGQ